MNRDRYAMLSGEELGSLGSTAELCNRLGFSPSLVSGGDSAGRGLWSRPQFALEPNGIRSCFRGASNGSRLGCGLAASLRVACGLPSYSGVGLFITTCSCGSLGICAFRSSTAVGGGPMGRLTRFVSEVRWATLPAMSARNDKNSQMHSLRVVASSGTSASVLLSALKERGGFALSGSEA